MNNEKLQFLETGLVQRLQGLDADAKGKWGLMNGQQMTEHVTGFFKVSSGRLKFPLITPEEHLPKFKEFLWSDKEFRENTKAPLEIVPEHPLPPRNATMQQSVEELGAEVKAFTDHFTNGTATKTLHPVFGELDFDEWVQLHHKHVTHHLKQFGLL